MIATDYAAASIVTTPTNAYLNLKGDPGRGNRRILYANRTTNVNTVARSSTPKKEPRKNTSAGNGNADVVKVSTSGNITVI